MPLEDLPKRHRVVPAGVFRVHGRPKAGHGFEDTVRGPRVGRNEAE